MGDGLNCGLLVLLQDVAFGNILNKRRKELSRGEASVETLRKGVKVLKRNMADIVRVLYRNEKELSLYDVVRRVGRITIQKGTKPVIELGGGEMGILYMLNTLVNYKVLERRKASFKLTADSRKILDPYEGDYSNKP